MHPDDLASDPAELRRFRNTVAAIAKFLIRARRTREPDFMTRAEYADWYLTDPRREKYSVPQLLELALRATRELDQRYSICRPSGGYYGPEESEGIVGVIKMYLSQFVDPVYGLPEAVDAAKSGHDVVLSTVAGWEALPNLRKALNRLPYPPGTESAGEKEGPDFAGNLWWDGDQVRLEPVPYRLCLFLWGKERVAVGTIVSAVWGEEDLVRNPRALTSALTKLTTAMAELNVPWTYRQKQGYVVKE